MYHCCTARMQCWPIDRDHECLLHTPYMMSHEQPNEIQHCNLCKVWKGHRHQRFQLHSRCSPPRQETSCCCCTSQPPNTVHSHRPHKVWMRHRRHPARQQGTWCTPMLRWQSTVLMSTHRTSSSRRCPDICPMHSSHIPPAPSPQHTSRAHNQCSRAILPHSDTAPQDTERTPTAPWTSMAMCTVPPRSRCIPPPPCCPGTDHTHTADSRQQTSDPSDSSTDPQHTRCSPKPRRCPSQIDTCPPHSPSSPRPRHCR